MIRLSHLFIVFPISLFSASTKAQDSSKGDSILSKQSTILLNEHNVKWEDDPMGIKVAVLQGNPYEKGLYTIRVIVPAKWSVAPHWHPNMEVVTVLKGSLFVGTGKRFDESKAVLVEKAGLSAMPAKVVHYAFTKEECIFQVHGMGPVERFFINTVEGKNNK
jgi:hypothetical protein